MTPPPLSISRCSPHRAEIEAQEGVIEQLEKRLGEAERRLHDANKRAAAAEAATAEKESMLGYVGEEVERVKGLFEQKVGGGGGGWGCRGAGV